MILINIFKTNEIIKVVLLKHKNKGTYSFVNLSRGHICPCEFNTPEEAFDDLENNKKAGKFVNYELVPNFIV